VLDTHIGLAQYPPIHYTRGIVMLTFSLVLALAAVLALMLGYGADVDHTNPYR
jgi:hypothetical protein